MHLTHNTSETWGNPETCLFANPLLASSHSKFTGFSEYTWWSSQRRSSRLKTEQWGPSQRSLYSLPFLFIISIVNSAAAFSQSSAHCYCGLVPQQTRHQSPNHIWWSRYWNIIDLWNNINFSRVKGSLHWCNALHLLLIQSSDNATLQSWFTIWHLWKILLIL